MEGVVIFTRHAIERYRQFHMLDRPAATDEDARIALEAHAAESVKLPARTYRGDEVWTIHALGVELVVKRDTPDPTCVTVLPPARFRGLTPLLAEQAEELARKAAERVAEAERKIEEAKKATAARKALAAQAAEAKKSKDKPGTSAAAQVEAHAAAAARKAAVAQAQRDYEERIQRAKNEASFARNERDITVEALKAMRAQLAQEGEATTAMRQQLVRDHDAAKYKAALRIAVRALLDAGATEALAEIATIEPGLASEAFANGGRTP